MDGRTTTIPAECDVLVVGSGAAGLMAANRAADLGLDTVTIEKAEMFGGTTALSGGGIWIPCSRELGDRDDPQAALDFLRRCCREEVPEARLRAYIEGAPQMMEYLQHGVGVRCFVRDEFPDYMQYVEGAHPGGRTMFPDIVDAGLLEDDFFRLRQTTVGARLWGRINVPPHVGRALAARTKGWRKLFLRLLADYWLDLPWRRKTRLDRRLGMGIGLVAGLRLGLKKRKAPLFLNTRLERLVMERGRVAGAVISRDGNAQTVRTRRGVILGSGGFEQNQALRDLHLPIRTEAQWSVTPSGYNSGDALLAGQAVGADTACMSYAWYCPSIRFPARATPNVDTRSGTFAERSFAHSFCVDRTGRRFANEALSYHDFGLKMLEAEEATGKAVPCWMIFDGQYRAKTPLGPLLPSFIMPDSSVPLSWWGTILHRAETVEDLARSIQVDPGTFIQTVERFNGFARTGVDEDFGRGSSPYDSVYCNPQHKPNPSLGTLAHAPFYAVKLDLGDIGTMGGLRADENGQVLDRAGSPIPGLYASGNCASPVTGGAYPGAGATLGPAMTFSFLAANHIAAEVAGDQALPALVNPDVAPAGVARETASLKNDTQRV